MDSENIIGSLIAGDVSRRNRHICRVAMTAFRLIILLVGLISWSLESRAGDTTYVIKENIYEKDTQGYNATSVVVDIMNLGHTEMPALFYRRSVYLPVTVLFDFLKIKSAFSQSQDSISGFITNEQDVYLIDKARQRIYYRDKYTSLEKGDLIQTGHEVYMKLNYFCEVFGMECRLDFRSLSVSIKAMPGLPFARSMGRDALRQEMKYLKGPVKADTIIRTERAWFHLGMADWSIINMQQEGKSNDTRANLNLGLVLAGGATTVGINYLNNSGFDSRQQYYLWRYADDNCKMLRQVSVGRIVHKSTASIYAPVAGIQFSNSRTTPRQSFGSYRLTDMTKPGWMVELYVNDMFVDYIQADAAGFFSFDVPTTPGNIMVKLRFYGPYGEEYSRVRNIYIPYGFLPKNEFEYTLSAALIEDGKGSRFSKISTSYGLTDNILINSGIEYLSSVRSEPYMPFVNASIRAGNHLLFSGEYISGVRSKSTMSCHLSAKVWLELNYTRYSKGQTAIIYNYLEDRRATLFLPFKIGNFNGITHLSLNQSKLPGDINYTKGEWSVSGTISSLSLNITTFSSSLGKPVPEHIYPNSYCYSNASMTFKGRKGFMLTMQGQFAYNDGEVVSVRCAAEKIIYSKGVVNVSYERNFKSNISGISLGLRYDFAFARLNVVARQYNNTMSMVQSARGSLIYDSKTNHLGSNNYTSVGKAGIVFVPFLDLNGNGKKDANESKMQGLKVKINGGRILNDTKDTLVRVLDLDPYVQYTADFNQSSFEDVTLQVRHKTLGISVMPDQLQMVEIPISYRCEISGTIYSMTSDQSKNTAHLKVQFYNSDGSAAGYTYSEADGSYYYPNLLPGSYMIQIDKEQLELLKLKASPEVLVVKINNTAESNKLDFVLKARTDE